MTSQASSFIFWVFSKCCLNVLQMVFVQNVWTIGVHHPTKGLTFRWNETVNESMGVCMFHHSNTLPPYTNCELKKTQVHNYNKSFHSSPHLREWLCVCWLLHHSMCCVWKYIFTQQQASTILLSFIGFAICSFPFLYYFLRLNYIQFHFQWWTVSGVEYKSITYIVVVQFQASMIHFSFYKSLGK